MPSYSSRGLMLYCPNRSTGGTAGHIRKRKATTNHQLSRVRGPRNAALGPAAIPDQAETPPGLCARVGAVASTANALGLAVLNQFKKKTSLWGPYRVLIVPISRFHGLQRWRLIMVHGELHCICRVVDRAARHGPRPPPGPFLSGLEQPYLRICSGGQSISGLASGEIQAQ
jgi:hypothetical protein